MKLHNLIREKSAILNCNLLFEELKKLSKINLVSVGLILQVRHRESFTSMKCCKDLKPDLEKGYRLRFIRP